ncbi:tetratricopeptide repeat protein [Sulfitobacter albidus]|uniref:Tetratricopeptide repeat protein n=1 Tax=Sulfitobacter albidus TaxID=2829501 RepID=A0A975PLF6_9RHOB|nr:tetratricopeptide repeat protein [Sulfitobacter albidus]QUJ75321.1 tetratricopeptide repeat protein [Sulfitobacter albidus]
MRHFSVVSTVLTGALFLSACAEQNADETVERAFQDVNVIDENNLGEVMLTVGDPNEAVTYFQRTLQEAPDNIDSNRGLALSLIRAKRFDEGTAAWQRTVALPGATDADRVELADAMIRSGNWSGAEQTLTAIPPTHETFKRYRLEAIVADSKQQWKKADSFYETAVGLTTKPAPVLNNWGYSKLTRGAYADAERLFTQAVAQDSALFTAKNNLVLARGAQRNYALPVVPMSQTERAQLLHTMALSAIKQGDVETGKGLLRDAIDTHPQHFEAAARSLSALES